MWAVGGVGGEEAGTKRQAGEWLLRGVRLLVGVAARDAQWLYPAYMEKRIGKTGERVGKKALKGAAVAVDAAPTPQRRRSISYR